MTNPIESMPEWPLDLAWLLEELEDAYDVKRAEKIMAKKPRTHTLEELERALLGKSALKIT